MPLPFPRARPGTNDRKTSDRLRSLDALARTHFARLRRAPRPKYDMSETRIAPPQTCSDWVDVGRNEDYRGCIGPAILEEDNAAPARGSQAVMVGTGALEGPPSRTEDKATQTLAMNPFTTAPSSSKSTQDADGSDSSPSSISSSLIVDLSGSYVPENPFLDPDSGNYQDDDMPASEVVSRPSSSVASTVAYGESVGSVYTSAEEEAVLVEKSRARRARRHMHAGSDDDNQWSQQAGPLSSREGREQEGDEEEGQNQQSSWAAW